MSGKRRVRDFQKIDPHLRSHPAFLTLRAELGVSTNVCHGLLAGMWAFAFDFAHDGNLSRFTPKAITLALDWDGDGDVLLAALKVAGFMDEKGRINDWHKWGGALFAERDSDARRKWDERNRPEQEKMSADVTGHNRTMRDNAPEEKRREEKELFVRTKNVLTHAESKRASAKYTPEFEQWWETYGRQGSKADAFFFWRLWRKRGTSHEELVAAATNYRAYCEVNDRTMKDGRTFLAKDINRWEEWVKPEAKPNGNGKPPRPERQAAPGHEWQCSRDPWSGKDEWLEVPCST